MSSTETGCDAAIEALRDAAIQGAVQLEVGILRGAERRVVRVKRIE